jgi:hypothetical protein
MNLGLACWVLITCQKRALYISPSTSKILDTRREVIPTMSDFFFLYARAEWNIHSIRVLFNKDIPMMKYSSLQHIWNGSFSSLRTLGMWFSSFFGHSYKVNIFFFISKKISLKKRKAPLSIQEVYTEATQLAHKKTHKKL